MKPLRLGDKIVGRVDPEQKTFHTTRDLSRHYAGKHEGFGISRHVIKYLQAEGYENVILTIDGVVYNTPLYAWTKHSAIDKLNEHEGWQLFLSWKRIRTYQAAMLEQKPKTQTTL